MNKIWVLVWYAVAFLITIFAMWLISLIGDLWAKHTEKKIKRKIALYAKYGRVYKYNGIFKDLI